MIRFISLILFLIIKYVRCDYLSNSIEENGESIYQDTVRIDMYYESLCPGSISTYLKEFLPVVQNLNKYIKVHIYPFGGAKITYKDGEPEIKCHHGPKECKRNALHACAIYVLKDTNDYVEFIACLMSEPTRSVNECGRLLKMNSKAIKHCAKSKRVMKLFKYYEKETKKQHLRYVPYFLINGKNLKNTYNLMDTVCSAFKKRPYECEN